MDRNRAKELLPAFTAFANGEDIQRRKSGGGFGWIEETGPMWSDNSDYRPEPKPREGYIHANDLRDNCAGSLKSLFKVREVIDE